MTILHTLQVEVHPQLRICKNSAKVAQLTLYTQQLESYSHALSMSWFIKMAPLRHSATPRGSRSWMTLTMHSVVTFLDTQCITPAALLAVMETITHKYHVHE